MKKILIGVVILTAILFISLFIIFRYSDKDPVRCNSHIYAEIQGHDKTQATLDLNLTLFTVKNGSSELLLSGSVSTAETQYVVARRMFFSSKPSNFAGFYKMKWMREERNHKDNLPDALWPHILPEMPGKEFYAGIKPLSDRELLIHKLATPYFVCAIAED